MIVAILQLQEILQDREVPYRYVRAFGQGHGLELYLELLVDQLVELGDERFFLRGVSALCVLDPFGADARDPELHEHLVLHAVRDISLFAYLRYELHQPDGILHRDRQSSYLAQCFQEHRVQRCTSRQFHTDLPYGADSSPFASATTVRDPDPARPGIVIPRSLPTLSANTWFPASFLSLNAKAPPCSLSTIWT